MVCSSEDKHGGIVVSPLRLTLELEGFGDGPVCVRFLRPALDEMLRKKILILLDSGTNYFVLYVRCMHGTIQLGCSYWMTQDDVRKTEKASGTRAL